eukprot:CAMPEP_0173448306 /NCGR_PEP_ID=MMETSP1357-20121228/40498_1 /TAXON_ID=77926 /ORGANISM="Hemiselmis rufescens, Strain PCC563" /LENGTH=47 /DNA_ID= /DNA_START= /DNA_END= /DNA_ORIENTATION=
MTLHSSPGTTAHAEAPNIPKVSGGCDRFCGWRARSDAPCAAPVVKMP